MNWRKRIYSSALKGKRTWLDRYFSILAVLAIVFGSLSTANAAPVVQQPVAAATTNAITLNVMSTDGTTAIPDYKWLINVDNSGNPLDAESDCRPTDPANPDPNYLSLCDWPSVHTIRGSSPIFTQGTQADLNGTTSLNLPPGKYLISVTADSYKIDGKHFTVPMEEVAATPGIGLVEVQMRPLDLPPATLRIKVFIDDGFTNGQFDAPAEDPQPGEFTPKFDSNGAIRGFKAHFGDPLGEISTDVFGNPLCTKYAANGDPLPSADQDPYQQCLYPDASGVITIPNLGPNRYEVWVVPPDGENWIETTTLEGNFGWDGWVQEGATGYDTEFVVGAEPFPWTIFGFVPGNTHYRSGQAGAITTAPDMIDGGPTALGSIEGDVHSARVYVPWNAGNPYNGDIWGGFRGVRDGGPLAGARIALSSIALGDQLVYVGQADDNGHFQITNVPDGNYTLTFWDDPLLYILDFQQVTVAGGVVTNMTDTNNNGVLEPALGESPLHLTGWWTNLEGTVYLDNGVAADGTNLGPPARANGKRDCQLDVNNAPTTNCEGGVFNYPLVIKSRGNNVVERGAVATVTGGDGSYEFANTYPFGWWMVLEAYSDRFYTTGVTAYNVDFTPMPPFNNPNANPLNPQLAETAAPVYIPGQGVDVNFLPIIGQTGRVDWGVLPYDPTGRSADLQNGGIVGTVSYDVTRNELDPRFAAVENWQPGIPGLTVNLYKAAKCISPVTQTCDSTKKFQIESTGAYLKGPLLNTAITESWEQPTGCIARDASGRKVVEQALPLANDSPLGLGLDDAKCLEGPMMGVQFGQTFATVDGNYGFGDYCADGSIPVDGVCGTSVNAADSLPLPAGDYLVEVVIPNDTFGNPLYKVTTEADINVFSGDSYTPQLPPPMCAGPLKLVDSIIDNLNPYNPTFNDPLDPKDGSPWEGVNRPTCDVKLVQLGSGRSIAPSFNLYTDVPLPGKYYGYIVDDLNVATDPRALFFGEKNGIAAPIGIYDYANRLVTTINSDPHGVFEVLLPSTDTISCPTPSGICANVYRLVGNDPGQPGRFNANYNPQYRTISANFEVWPGIIMAADLAPTQMAASIQAPGSQFNNVAQCVLDTATPQLFAVSQPYVNGSGAFTIRGLGFGTTAGQVALDGSIILPTTSWTDRQIAVTVPAGTPAGLHQLSIKASNGQSTINGLTFHVLSDYSAFPATGVLDDFNRVTPNVAGNILLGTNWAGQTLPTNYRIQTNVVQARANNGFIYWNGATFGPDQEAYYTFTDVSTTAAEQDLALKITGLAGTSIGPGTAMIEALYDKTTSTTPDQIRIETLAPGQSWMVRATFAVANNFFANGDQFGARALADGTVNVYKNGALIGSTNITTGPTPWLAALAAGGGQIGVWFLGAGNSTAQDARFDNFGGGNVPANTYLPTLFEVGVGKAYDPTDPARITTDPISGLQYEHALQDALDAAANVAEALVVVYPGPTGLFNPHGVYYENIIMHSPVKLQGVGPGGVYADTTGVLGSVISGLGFGADTAYAGYWRALIGGLNIATPGTGELLFAEGQTVTVVATDTEQYNTPSYKAAIDGFTIEGGDQMGFPNNLNQIGGAQNGLPAVVETQGGGIFVYSYARNLQITNNHIKNNSGSYAGGIRIGTPNWEDSHNDDIRIANNRIFANGGTNLAGGIGVFEGSRSYEIANNDLCGNFSAEYGGGISVYGLSPNGKIHHNRIYFNRSYDEGGGVMLAGELPADPLTLSPGTGPVDIYSNRIQANLANDDGGGIRFLMAGNFPMNVYNNFIVNNISTHEGGGIALDDAPDVRFFNNTVMKNITTATAMTSDGNPAPAGLATTFNSAAMQATLPLGSPEFSSPLMFNNIFWGNRAGKWDIARAAVSGIGITGDPNPIRLWDMGSTDGSGPLMPTNSMLNEATLSNIVPSASNQIGVNPQVIATYDTSVAVMPWRTMPGMTGIALVAVDLPPNLLGNYHLTVGSPARNMGAAGKTVGALTADAPLADFDGDPRPSLPGYEIGADELPVTVYLTLQNNFTFPASGGPGASLATRNEDILSFSSATGTFDMVLDGSDVGLGSVTIDDFAILSTRPTVQILMSFAEPIEQQNGNPALPGIPAAFGAVDDSDVVLFTATSLGNVTTGTFSVYFDGSDVGLANNAEDVDAIEILPTGELVVSTSGNFSVPVTNPGPALPAITIGGDGAPGGRVLIKCTGTFGENTACNWSIYFDGRDVGLDVENENLDGLAVAPNGNVYLSTSGNFTVPLAPTGNLTGQDEDIFVCQPVTLGDNTACIYLPTVFFDGTTLGLGGNDVAAIELP